MNLSNVPKWVWFAIGGVGLVIVLVLYERSASGSSTSTGSAVTTVPDTTSQSDIQNLEQTDAQTYSDLQQLLSDMPTNTQNDPWSVTNPGGANLFTAAAPQGQVEGNVPAGTPLQNASIVPAGTELEATGPAEIINWGGSQASFLPVTYAGAQYLTPLGQVQQGAG